MKRSFLVAVLAALAVVAVAPAATAAPADDTQVGLEGRGVLSAGGAGHVEVSGAGRVRLTLAGDVTIVDHAGDARIWVRGVPAAAATALTLEDFRGVVRVVGSDFTVEADGRIVLRAAGTGSALLAGHGWFWVRHCGPGGWSDAGVPVAYPA